VLRDASSLAATAAVLGEVGAGDDTPEGAEVANLATVGRALVAAATAREESRGAHTRSDFPTTSDAFRCRLVVHG
jgi:L-aspartate oxidase